MAEAANKNSGFNGLVVVGATAVVLIFIFAFTLFLQGGFKTVLNQEFQKKVLDADGGDVVDSMAQQQAILDEGFRWVDEANGKVGMPLDEAKALVVRRGQ